VLLFTAASTHFVSRYVLRSHELGNAGGLVADEGAYLFQARVFLEGRLYAESHPLPKFFDAKFVVNDGRMYSQYPPGHPLVLALGLLLFGHPRHLLLLLTALVVLYTYLIGRQFYDRKVAVLAAALTCISPFFVFTSATLLSHTPNLFFLLGFVFHLTRSLRAPRLAHAVAAGLFLGFAGLIRPYTAPFVALPFLAVVGLQLWRRRWPARHAAVFGSIGLLFAALLLGANQFYNGDPFSLGYHKYIEQQREKPYVTLENPRRPFTALVADTRLARTYMQLKKVNLWYLGFPLELGLILMFPLIQRKNRWDYASLSVLPCLLCGYGAFEFAPVSHTGPLYYYEAIPFLSLVVARSYLAFRGMLPTPAVRRATGLLLALVLGGSMLRFGVVRVSGLDELVRERTDPATLIREQGLHDAIVFMGRVPFRPNIRYTYNSPDFRDDVLRVRDLRRRNQALMNFYPERRAYHYAYDPETGEGNLVPLIPDRESRRKR
jgi:4-amino-4-deoxy-L-arabinose transferase-like glycosyltransferase